MSDTECQRCGYDDTGRYHVRALWPPPEPDRDQCPDCRAAPDADHHPDCTMTVDSCGEAAQMCDSQSCAVDTHIPFRVQEWMFESLAETALMQIEDVLAHHEATILEMARDRFRKGYTQYGSTMYGWSPEERLREVLEELADSIVYLTSGAIK